MLSADNEAVDLGEPSGARAGAPPRARAVWLSALPLVAGRAISAVIGFVLPAVLARFLDRASYGSYRQFYLVANLAFYTLQLGLTPSLFYFLPRAANDRERRAFLGQTHLMLGVLGGVSVLSILVLAPWLSHHFSDPELQHLAMPLALLTGGLIASAPMEPALTAHGRNTASAIAQVSSEVVRIAALTLPVALGYGLTGLAWGAAGAALVRWCASLILAAGPGFTSWSVPLLRQQLAYSLPVGLANLIAMPQQQLHQIFVAAGTAPAQFALYSVGCMQIPVVALLYGPVAETLQVRISSLPLNRSGEARKAFEDSTARLALVFWPLCGGLMGIAAPLLSLIYGPSYAPAASIFRVAVLSVAIAAIPADAVLRARARTTVLVVTNGIKLAATWPLLMLGFHFEGMVGAIGAHLLVELCTRVGLLTVAARELQCHALDFVRSGRFVRSGLLALAVGVTSRTASHAIARPLLGCVAAGVAGAAVLLVEVLRVRWMERGAALPFPLREATPEASDAR